MNKYLITLLLIFTSLLRAQIKIKHFTTQDGLPHDFTFRLFQDEKGYLWIGSDDGLAKFNGEKFKVFDRSHGLKSNFVIESRAYHEDTLLISNWKGGIHFMINDSIIIPKIKNDNYTNILSSSVIGKDIFSNSFAGTHFKYERMDGLNFKKRLFQIRKNNNDQIIFEINKLKPFPINCRSKKIKNTLYFFKGEYNYKSKKNLTGVYKYLNNDSIKRVFPFLKDHLIYAFGQHQSDLFYASVQDELFLFNSDKIIQHKRFSIDKGVILFYAETSFCEVIVARDKNTGNDCIYIYDKEKKTLENISKKMNPKILISDLLVDRNENIWITCKSDGLFQIYKDQNLFSSIISGKEDIIEIISSDDEMIYFNTQNKIYGYDHKNQKLYSQLISRGETKFSTDKITNNEINLFSSHNNQLNFPSFLGRRLKSTTKFNNKKDHLSYDAHFVWYQNKKTKQINKIIPKINDQYPIITEVIKVNNDIWIGTQQGILIFNRNKKTFISFIKGNKMDNKWIKKMIFQEGKGIWVNSDFGLSLVEENGNVINFSKQDGLVSTRINDLLIDHYGILWIATQKGLSIYDQNKIYNLNIHDHLPFSYVSSLEEDKDGQLWIGGNKGIVKLDNSKAPFQPTIAPKLIVEKKQTMFEIDAIDYSGKIIQLQYQSKSDQLWKDLVTEQLEFSDYAIGNYQFRFRAKTLSSSWVYSKNFPIKINQVWYKTLVFIVSVSLIGVIFISLLIYLQLHRVKNRNQLLKDSLSQSVKLEKELGRVRENMAQDFHDELGNKLAGITMISGMLMNNQELKKSKSIGLITQIQKDANELYSGIKDFVWSIDSKSDDLYELIFYLTDFGEDLFEPLGISYKVKRNPIPKNLKLPYYWSKQLMLLFKEAMTNSFKHSQASEVLLEFYYSDPILKVSLSDNGKGFHSKSLKRKNGINNMKKRAANIGGQLTISSNNGTFIYFEGHIHKKAGS